MASSQSGFPKEGRTHFQKAWAWVEGSGKTPAATSDMNLCSSGLKMQCESRASAETENSSRVSHQSGFSGYTILVYQNPGVRQQMWDVRTISEIRRHKWFKVIYIYSPPQQLTAPLLFPQTPGSRGGDCTINSYLWGKATEINECHQHFFPLIRGSNKAAHNVGSSRDSSSMGPPCRQQQLQRFEEHKHQEGATLSHPKEGE